MGLLDFMRSGGASSDAYLAEQQAEDKLLMAKLFRHLRNEGLEESVDGLDLKVRDSRVTVYGHVDSSGAADRVVQTLVKFGGVASVNNQLSVRPQASHQQGGRPEASNPAPPSNPDPQGGDAAEAPPVAGRTPAEDATAPGKKPEETSNSNPKASNIKKVGAPPVYHVVGEGTTLWAVAEKYLGDGNRYMEIFEANRPMLKDPDVLTVGQKLKIPQRR
jgi:LysM repeat protein